mgnify:CR=1 FL=1
MAATRARHTAASRGNALVKRLLPDNRYGVALPTGRAMTDTQRRPAASRPELP